MHHPFALSRMMWDLERIKVSSHFCMKIHERLISIYVHIFCKDFAVATKLTIVFPADRREALKHHAIGLWKTRGGIIRTY
jgi:hypothetical protein